MTMLGIIIASTRPGRVGLPVGKWMEREARMHSGFGRTSAKGMFDELVRIEQTSRPLRPAA